LEIIIDVKCYVDSLKREARPNQKSKSNGTDRAKAVGTAVASRRSEVIRQEFALSTLRQQKKQPLRLITKWRSGGNE